ncbi:hypothetical protein LGK95_08675 [Clostridium algoriphilum]|uniref:hypothetical protein n=1 Tax=Clostridium algoriphilum TaxID=198347 RepID=UPI001CF183D8|nr:hypothetical protein [Clostridium algoriphilum]MCB2293595.1 hypothetical protein [Clostridium algoriphilum]
MKFLKLIILVLSFSLLSTSVIFAEDGKSQQQELKSKGFKEVIVNEWNEDRSKDSTFAKIKTEIINRMNISKSKVVVHNNGKPIKTDMLVEKQGNELVAISKEIKNGINYETYYFSNNDSNNINDVFKKIVSNDDVNTVSSSAVQGTGQYVRTYNWSFYRSLLFGKDLLVATMSDSIEFSRKSTTASINGTIGSIWDIKANSQVQRNTSTTDRLNEEITTLDVADTSQQLLDWGPTSTSSTKVSVGLAGIVPTVGWIFDSSGFKITDLSNKGAKYGKWKFAAPSAGATSSLTTKPGIRVTNTSGDLKLNLSHTLDFKFSDHSTGVINVLVGDR